MTDEIKLSDLGRGDLCCYRNGQNALVPQTITWISSKSIQTEHYHWTRDGELLRSSTERVGPLEPLTEKNRLLLKRQQILKALRQAPWEMFNDEVLTAVYDILEDAIDAREVKAG